MALAGRTRATGRGGAKLAQRIARWLEKEDAYENARRLLSSGNSVVKTRDISETQQGSIFDAGGGMLELHSEDEERLAARLGAGFRCAPPDPEADKAKFDEMLAAIDALFATAVTEFNGTPPAIGEPASDKDRAAMDTWLTISDEITSIVVRHLQRDVRSDLGI